MLGGYGNKHGKDDLERTLLNYGTVYNVFISQTSSDESCRGQVGVKALYQFAFEVAGVIFEIIALNWFKSHAAISLHHNRAQKAERKTQSHSRR